MKNSERITELVSEVEALRAEVAQLRTAQAAHYCYAPPQPSYQPYIQTTCAVPWQNVHTVNEPYYLAFANTGCAPPATTLVLATHGAN